MGERSHEFRFLGYKDVCTIEVSVYVKGGITRILVSREQGELFVT